MCRTNFSPESIPLLIPGVQTSSVRQDDDTIEKVNTLYWVLCEHMQRTPGPDIKSIQLGSSKDKADSRVLLIPSCSISQNLMQCTAEEKKALLESIRSHIFTTELEIINSKSAYCGSIAFTGAILTAVVALSVLELTPLELGGAISVIGAFALVSFGTPMGMLLYYNHQGNIIKNEMAAITEIPDDQIQTHWTTAFPPEGSLNDEHRVPIDDLD